MPVIGDNKGKKILTWFPKSFLEKLDRVALVRGETRSSLIRAAVLAHLQGLGVQFSYEETTTGINPLAEPECDGPGSIA